MLTEQQVNHFETFGMLLLRQLFFALIPLGSTPHKAWTQQLLDR